jgi:Lon protease (S16) C-terminal proteolytic domain
MMRLGPFTMRLLPLLAIALLSSGTVVGAADRSYLITIPTLSVSSPEGAVSSPEGAVSSPEGKPIGAPSYTIIQIAHLSQPVGPEILFNEGPRGLGAFKGSKLGPDWKEAAQQATFAASRAVGEDPRTWQVTFKGTSSGYPMYGPSASAALAIAMVVARRGDTLLPGVVITGAVDPEGRISAVGRLPEKILMAAGAGFSTILIPSGQTRTQDWDLRPLAESLHMTVIEVSTIKEAYERMTGQSF